MDRLYEKYQYLIEGITKKEEKYGDAVKALNKLKDAGRINQEQMTEALKTYNDELNGTTDMAKDAAKQIQDYFAEFLFNPFEGGVDGMLESFSDMIKKMVVQAQAAQLARALFGDLIEGGTGKGIVGGTLTDFFRNFSGMFASGGYIPSGQWGIVGENGPELAFGGGAGKTIVPSGKIAMGGNGGGITVNVINNNNSAVKTQAGTNGAEMDIILDNAIAKKIGTKGSSTNSALNTYSSRSRIKR